MEKGANPNAVRSILHEETVLYIAAKKGDIEIIELLLKYGADIDKGRKGRKGQNSTPLSIAIEFDKEEAAIFLVKNGANIHSEDQHKSTPLHNAAYQESRELVAFL